MIKNYLKIAWRNLLKNKTFSLINIAGLAIGLCSFLLIALYVADELNYDRYNDKADRIYRVNSDIRFGGTDLRLAVCSDPMGATLKRDYPQVEEYVRIYNSSGSKLIKKGNEFIDEQRVAHADSTLFNVFTLPAIEGDTKNALNEPNTVVITESTAKKYFGTTNAVGKTVETNSSRNNLYKVTAVIKDIPHNSHFNFDFIFSMDNVEYDFGNYLSHNFQTYILLKKGMDYKAFEKNFPQVVDKYVLPQAKQFMQINTMDDFRKNGNSLEYHLMPLTDIHLRSDRTPELGVNGNIQYVYIFSAVALFILLIACINFMNLSTARSASRSKEVGIRKVLGTDKNALIWQFLTESTLMVFIALVVALLIAWAILPFFNSVSTKTLTFATFFSYKTLPFLLLLPFVVGTLAGSYPAFFLSSFQPIVVLKGRTNAGFKKSTLRSGLVVFQFFISIFLIIGVTIIYRQLDYIQNKKLGYNKDQVLILNGTSALGKSAESFKNEVAKMSGVKSASFSGYLPVSNSARNDNTYSTQAVMDTKSGFNMQTWNIDYDYLNTLGMEIVKGRNFSREFGSDSSAILINETTAKIIGYDNPIGKKLYTFDGVMPPKSISYTIIGVVKNFNFESLHQNIGPLCFRMGNNSWSTAFKVSATDVTGLLKNIENKWKAMAPGMPFSYQFLDDAFDNMYRSEQRVGKIALAFAILTILIACLGLFGLATYMAEQRTKEIGVRKVLGASIQNVVSMLSKDFLKLVFVGALIAFPIAWYSMHKWLEDFAFRVDMSWWIFAFAGFIALLIALATVSFQAIKAAMANPVKSLRTE
ncbi:MAG: transporter permease [Ferruginibacter sp.]|nr:transporter permease [Ferruginibacter sp.]